MNRNFIENMPEMKSGQELISFLTVLPEYDDSIRNENQAIRLMQLSDLYRMYIPSNMSLEIYSKLYLALLRSLQKKGTQAAVRQKYENYKRIQNQDYRGIIGGSDSFTIIGTSGIGKSSAISRAIELITENQMIEVEEPYTKIIPCVIVQCPFDSSVKGLLLEILRKVTENIDAISRKGDRYSIKSTSNTTTGVFYGLEPEGSSIPDKQKFEYVIICKFDDDYELETILELDWDTFLKNKHWHKRMTAWNLSLT